MKPILDWLQHNKEWVFSGAGVTVIAAVIGLLVSALRSRAHERRRPGLQVNLAFGGLNLRRPSPSQRPDADFYRRQS